jgi:hypothetical protein
MKENSIYNITYGQLEETLLNLGFIKHTNNGSTVYVEQLHESVIAIPTMPQEDMVSPLHLTVARNQVTECGIAEPADFEAALEKVVA